MNEKMIDKLSDNEIEQLLKELGLSIKKSALFNVRNNYASEIDCLFKNKPILSQYMQSSGRISPFIGRICAYTLNMIEKTKRKDTDYYRQAEYANSNLAKEYLEMYSEICEIIKKHFKEWEE